MPKPGHHQAASPVRTMCCLHGVSTAGYDAWLQRPASRHSLDDAQLIENIQAVDDDSL